MGERSRNNLGFVCNFSFGCLALHRHIHRWSRCLAKTPVCFLSQWGWGERFARVCLPLGQKKSNQKARWNGCIANNAFSEFSCLKKKKVFKKSKKKKKVITWPICYIKWLSVYKLFLKKFLCLYKKSVDEKNFKRFFCIFCCKNLFLLLRYTLDSLWKKRNCLFWMAEAKATLVSLTLLFSSS